MKAKRSRWAVVALALVAALATAALVVGPASSAPKTSAVKITTKKVKIVITCSYPYGQVSTCLGGKWRMVGGLNASGKVTLSKSTDPGDGPSTTAVLRSSGASPAKMSARSSSLAYTHKSRSCRATADWSFNGLNGKFRDYRASVGGFRAAAGSVCTRVSFARSRMNRTDTISVKLTKRG